MGVRGGTGLLSRPTDVSPRESILPPSRITGSPPRARIFASRNPIPRSRARARDTHNFAIMIPETGGLSRAVIDPSRGDAPDFYRAGRAASPLLSSASPPRQLLSARHVRIFFARGNEIFQMLSRSVYRVQRAARNLKFARTREYIRSIRLNLSIRNRDWLTAFPIDRGGFCYIIPLYNYYAYVTAGFVYQVSFTLFKECSRLMASYNFRNAHRRNKWMLGLHISQE